MLLKTHQQLYIVILELQFGPRDSQDHYHEEFTYVGQQCPTGITPRTPIDPLPPPYSIIDQHRPASAIKSTSNYANVSSSSQGPNFRNTTIEAFSTIPPVPLPRMTSVPSFPSSPAAIKVSFPPPIPKLPHSRNYVTHPTNPFLDFDAQAQDLPEKVKLEPSPFPPQLFRRIIDLDLELPKIKQEIKNNKNPNFLHFNKELNKSKPISEIRKELVNSDYLSDIRFTLDGQVIPAHKNFVITASFLFYDHFHVKGATEMMIEDIAMESFMKVLSYCYTDKIQVTQDSVLDLLLAGNKLQVRQVSNICNGFISSSMNPTTIFEIFDKALSMDSQIFQQKCIDFINKNEEKCFSSQGFFQVSLASLMKMLEFCKYPHGKINMIIEKYTNGSMSLVNEPAVAVVLDQASGTKPTGAVKKPKNKTQKPKQQNPKIPDLMSIPVQSPHMIPQFAFPPHMYHPPPQSFHNPMMGHMVNFDDDNCSIVDDNTRINITGPRYKAATDVSFVEFMCKRSLLIHDIGFSENLANSINKEIHINICVFEQNKRNDIHNRVINNVKKPGESKKRLLKR